MECRRSFICSVDDCLEGRWRRMKRNGYKLLLKRPGFFFSPFHVDDIGILRLFDQTKHIVKCEI